MWHCDLTLIDSNTMDSTAPLLNLSLIAVYNTNCLYFHHYNIHHTITTSELQQNLQQRHIRTMLHNSHQQNPQTRLVQPPKAHFSHCTNTTISILTRTTHLQNPKHCNAIRIRCICFSKPLIGHTDMHAAALQPPIIHKGYIDTRVLLIVT